MLVFQPWKVWTVILVCVLGVLFAAPNVVSHATLDRLPNWLPKHQVNLGLDLQGGSHLLLEVDVDSVTKERLNGDVDVLRTQLIKEKIGYTNIAVENDHIVLALRDAADQDRVKAMLPNVDADLRVTSGQGGVLQLAYSAEALKTREQQTVDQSIEIVRRRIDELGTKDPTIEREGNNRIVVQVPGVDDPQRIRDVVGQTAKLTFRLLDENANVASAETGKVPPGDDLLPLANSANEKQPAPPEQQFLVRKRVMVDGADLVSAQASFADNQPIIAFKFDSLGGRRFGDVTRDNVGKRFAIVLDNKVLSAPVIKDAILGGSGQISGNFTVQSANDLALLLRAGALPAPLTPIEERSVGPDLGADSIRAGTIASLIAVTLVGVFMVLFYGLFGIYADIALFMNLCLLLAALSVLGATLTLPGIAGIALTMGMAVDANVLLNERMREEVRNGRSVISAVDNGFNRAFGTIIDANVTHLIAGALLFELGSGPIKGFAVTFCIGIVTSLFSTIMVTRLLIIWWLRRRPKALPV